MPADDDDPDALRRLVFGRPPEFGDDESEDAHRASVSSAADRLRELGEPVPVAATPADDSGAAVTPLVADPLVATPDAAGVPVADAAPAGGATPSRRRRRWPLVVAGTAIAGIVAGIAIVQSLPTPLPDPLAQNVLSAEDLAGLGVADVIALANWHGWTVYVGPSDRIPGDNCLVLNRDGVSGSNCASGTISSPYDFTSDYLTPRGVLGEEKTFSSDFEYTPGDGLTITNPHGNETIHVVYRDDPQDLISSTESARIAASAPDWVVTTVDPRSVVTAAISSEASDVFGTHESAPVVNWHGSTVVVGRRADGLSDCIVVLRAGTRAASCGSGGATLSAVLDPATYSAPLPLEPRQTATFDYRPGTEVRIGFEGEKFVVPLDR